MYKLYFLCRGNSRSKSKDCRGNVPFDGPAGYSETLTGALRLGSIGSNASLSGAPAFTLTFKKAGAGANPVLIAYTGTATPASSPRMVCGAWQVLIMWKSTV